MLDPEALMKWLTEQGLEWVRTQRDRYRGRARVVTSSERAEMSPFFSSQYLDLVWVVCGPVVEEPPFYPQLQQSGFRLIPFSQMRAITYIDTVFLSAQAGIGDPPPLSLLFHELVHVVQYVVLGTEQFLNRYVRGYFERGQVYETIPLEAHAYDLQRQYEKSGHMTSFSVHARVEVMKQAY